MIRFYTEDFSEYIDVPSFEFGNADSWNRIQYQNKTINGKVITVDFDKKTRRVTGTIAELTQSQMISVRDFFIDTISAAIGKFFVRIPQTRYDKTWNAIAVPAYCGAELIDSGGSTSSLTCGSSVTCGGTINAAYEYIGPCTLNKAGIEISEPFEKIYQIEIDAVIEAD